MKRFTAILLALMILPIGALGASVRDIGTMETEHDSGVNALLDVVLTAAMVRDERALAEGEKPSEGLVEAVFGVYTYCETGALTAELSGEDAAALYRAFFGEGEYALPESGSCPCVTIEDGVMKMDLEELAERPLAGLWIYETRIPEENRVIVKGDMFTARGYVFASAWDVPDWALTWYCSASALLERDEGALFGWRVVSFELGEIYLDGAVTGWREVADEEAGYSLLVPGVLEPNGTGSFATFDGQVAMTVETLPLMDESAAKAYFENASDLKTERVDEGMLFATLEESGRTRLLIAGTDLFKAYLITLTYPEARRDEMTLYLEFIRNSFNEAGNVNG